MSGLVLVTGSSGQVGGAVVGALGPPGIEVAAPGRDELDLSSEASIRACVQHRKPRWIVNPAAYTAVDKAESEPELAHAINAEAPRILGEEAARIGAAVIHFSTDYVFDGTLDRPYREDDPTGPASVYGATKLAGEEALAASGAAHLIFRTSWVYGARGKNFLLTILRLARERGDSGQALRIVADQHGAPTSARDLAALAVSVIGGGADPRRQGGLYHAAGAGETTWHGFAAEIVRQARVSRPDVTWADPEPIPASAYPTPAKRPANSRLDCGRLGRELGFTFPQWQESLAEVMREIEA